MSVAISNLATTWTNSGTTYTGIKLNVTDTASAAASLLMDLQVGGSSKFKVDKSGVLTLTFAAATEVKSYSGYLHVNKTIATAGAVSFGIGAGVSDDAVLLRDAANTLAQRNGTNAQVFRVYNTFTDASNYERGFVRWDSNTFSIGTEAAGTGTARNVFVGSGAKGISLSFSTNRIFFSPDGGQNLFITQSGLGYAGWMAGTQYAIFGQTQQGNSNRAGSDVGLYPQGGSGNGTAGQVSLYSSRSNVSGTDAHLFELAVRTFLPTTGTPGLQFGGTTSSFPAIKRSTTVLQARLADDSDFGAYQGKLQTHANAVAETPTATHTITLYDAAGTAYKVLCVAA